MRIRAFTIIEVTIAMLISAIAIGITYTAFLIISHSYSTYDVKNKDMSNVLRLDELLRKDFSRALIVVKDTNGIALRFQLSVVKYKFDTAYVVRISGIADTFKVKVDSVKTLFENTAINETGTDDEQNRIDLLGLSLNLHHRQINYHYHKIYSSADLIKRKSDAVN